MIVQPKTAYFRASADTIKVVPSDWPAELFIECEAISPPSSAGRTVYLKVPAEQIPALLKTARDTAIAARNEPLGGSR
jgi:hypothetical protein